MKCPSCKAGFTPPEGRSVANCPFCGEPLLKPAVSKKCENLAEALAFIAENYGADILLHDRRLVAFLRDYLPKGNLERNILRQAFGLDIPAKFHAAIGKTPQEQQIVMARCVKQIADNYGAAENIVTAHLWVFAEVLGWEKRPEPEPMHAPKTAVEVGNIIPFGGYDWRVLAVENNKALLISEKVLEEREYNEERVAVTWEDCSLREYLNSEFYNKLGTDKAAVAQTCNTNPNNPWYGTNGGNDAMDKIFLLCLDELVKYFGDSGDLANKKRKNFDGKIESEGNIVYDQYNPARIAIDSSGEACWWWLRSPGSDSNYAANVNLYGNVDLDGSIVDDTGGGVRPALWLNL